MKTYNKARLEILNYIIQFSTSKNFSDKEKGYENYLANLEHTFRGSYLKEVDPPIGSLVMVSSAPFTKWYLSWLKEYKKGGYNGNYLLESIEDRSECWWSNCSIFYLPKETSDNFPQWKWTDKQFEFKEKWFRACKRRDAYIHLPCLPDFHEDGSVTLTIRTRFGLSEKPKLEITYPNWKKVTVKQLLEFYDANNK